MSALAQTYFCGNGHIVLQVPHGELPSSFPEKCPSCADPSLKVALEWKNSDYPCGSDVPSKPIGMLKGRSIYNVSKLRSLDKDHFFDIM